MDETQVGIIGAGPAGLVLAHLLHLAGIESIVLEGKAREYVEARVRAGVLEHGTARLLCDTGVGARMQAEGLVHHGVNLQFEGRRHRIDFAALTGRTITVYGQQEVVKDLVAVRLASGKRILFEAEATAVEGLDGDRPIIRYVQDGSPRELHCDFVAGCDGFHGCSRDAAPVGTFTIYEREYPFAWLGILADVAPSTEELIYSFHERGFAMHSLRSPTLSRLYLQVDPSDEMANWPPDRIWSELQVRLASPGWTLREGPIIEAGITAMRSFVAEPMQYGRLFLAGDAAHIVPPTGAKGLNLAVADVQILSNALASWYRTGDARGLDAYSAACLRRVWRAQDFSANMTQLLHRRTDADDFQLKLQRAQQEYLRCSEAMCRTIAENYVGYRWPDDPAAPVLAV